MLYRGTYKQLAVAERLADLTRLLQLIQSKLREAKDEIDARETAESLRFAHRVELLAADPAGKRRAGAQFTCFTSTKVQMLTLLAAAPAGIVGGVSICTFVRVKQGKSEHLLASS